MNLQECLDKLARGKLSNLAICNGGKVKPSEIPKIVDAINESLQRLHTSLPVKEKNLYIELCEGRTEYPLTSEHCLKNAKGDIHDSYDFYIMDTPDRPFEDDILTVSEVWDDLGRFRPLNDPEDRLSVFTPEPDCIVVNPEISGAVLSVIYRAGHKLLTPETLDTKIELPANLNGALMSYTAYLIHDTMNTAEAVQNSQKYYAEYQRIINEVIQNGTLNSDKLVLDRKFSKRGWV